MVKSAITERLRSISFSMIFVAINIFVLVLERRVTRSIFHSLCNVVVRIVVMLMLEGMLTCVRFSSWCNVLDDNVVVLVRNLTNIIFHSHAMLLLEIILWLC